jgi:hypothetical protein
VTDVVEALSGMQNCDDVPVHVPAVFGMPRRSAITAAVMLVALVWEVALRFVCTPTGIKPKTASKQKAATPRDSASSTRENAVFPRFGNLMAEKRESRHSLERAV